MSHVLETVSFKLIPGTGTAAFLATNQAINTWVKLQPGFLSRRLCQHDDGVWLDIVHWKSMQDAQTAAQKMMSEDFGQGAFMSMLDTASMVMRHGHLQVSI